MKRLFRNILVAIGGAFVLAQVQNLLGSDYIVRFLDHNLVSLLIALLAINSASLGIVLSKIRELADASGGLSDFSRTKNEMMFSVKEQIVLIFLSLVLLMVNDSTWLYEHQQLTVTIETAVITCFTYGMLILSDTARSIFIILTFKKNEQSN